MISVQRVRRRESGGAGSVVVADDETRKPSHVRNGAGLPGVWGITKIVRRRGPSWGEAAAPARQMLADTRVRPG